jgi:hypothetical protein
VTAFWEGGKVGGLRGERGLILAEFGVAGKGRCCSIMQGRVKSWLVWERDRALTVEIAFGKGADD